MLRATEYRSQLLAKGLDRYADALVELARPSVRLMPELVDESAVELGSAKIGGHPDLPEDTRWPEFWDVPMSFVAQINLAETHP